MKLQAGKDRIKLPPYGYILSVVLCKDIHRYPIQQVSMEQMAILKRGVDHTGPPIYFGADVNDIVFYPKADKQYHVVVTIYGPVKTL